mmetsp:Transcript_81469/g.226922  ORF Transcript_81469/g.226922 Transcript_81469/m.226922 type:complete len:260 (+) Transcript_81469:151-930(+)
MNSGPKGSPCSSTIVQADLPDSPGCPRSTAKSMTICAASPGARAPRGTSGRPKAGPAMRRKAELAGHANVPSFITVAVATAAAPAWPCSTATQPKQKAWLTRSYCVITGAHWAVMSPRAAGSSKVLGSKERVAPKILADTSALKISTGTGVSFSQAPSDVPFEAVSSSAASDASVAGALVSLTSLSHSSTERTTLSEPAFESGLSPCQDGDAHAVAAWMASCVALRTASLGCSINDANAAAKMAASVCDDSSCAHASPM